jgi:hypothetical protein
MFKTKDKAKSTDPKSPEQPSMGEPIVSNGATAPSKQTPPPPKNRAKLAKPKSAAGKSQRRLIRAGLLLFTGLIGISGGFLVLHRSSSTVPVYIATKGVPAGGSFVPSDIGVEQVPSPGVSGSLPLSQILHHNATVPILPGEVITKGLATNGQIQSNQAIVGISLTAGHMPSGGMSPGDQVELIYTGVQPLNNTPASSASPASSSTINALPGNILGAGVISSVTLAPNGGNTLVDLIVSGKAVPVITTAAANNDVSLARRS